MLYFVWVVLFIIILNRFAIMFVSYLKRIFIILLISVFALHAQAQQIHFVYLQTENGQPFYVKLNNRVISSSLSGYLILSNLIDGDYQLVIGFPKNEFPENTFHISVDKQNEGFLLKNFGEKGWSLFNMQSLALLPGSNSNVVVVAAPAKVQNDPFSKMLANVVKDSSILQNNEPVVAVKDTPVLQNNAVVSDNNVVTNDTANNKITASEPASTGSPSIPSITKVLSENDPEGMQMVYVDKNEFKNDTVRIFIPVEKEKSEKTEDTVSLENKALNPPPGTDSSLLTITPTVIIKPDTDTVTLINDTIKVYKQPVKNNSVTEAIKDSSAKDSSASKDNKAPVEVAIAEPVEKKSSQNPKIKKEDAIIVLPKVVTASKVNSDCKGFATDEDFLKLRKKMAAENNNDEMIKAAKKIFRTKCFSTEQIKNLSFLFLTDEGKYSFFDAAYAFASDSDQYHLLVSQMSDAYYVNRFNAMIHK